MAAQAAKQRGATADVAALQRALAAARRDAAKYRRRWQALRTGLLKLLEMECEDSDNESVKR